MTYSITAIAGTFYTIIYVLGTYFLIPFKDWGTIPPFINPLTGETVELAFLSGDLVGNIVDIIPMIGDMSILTLILNIFITYFLLFIIARIVAMFK